MLKLSLKLSVFFLLLFSSIHSYTQVFNEISGIVGEIYFVEYTEEHNIMFIGGEELYISNDDGQSWMAIDNSSGSGLSGFEFYGAAAMSATDYVVLCSQGGNDKLIVSNDAGQSWTETFSSSYTDYELGKDIIDAHNGTVIISGKYGVKRSTDFGQTWNDVVIGNYTDPSDFLIYNNQSQLWYVGAKNDGIALSSDNGATWSFLGLGLNGSDLRGSYASGMNTIISKETSNKFEFLTINEFGAITDTFLINKSEIYFGNKDIDRFGLTPDGDLLTQNDPVMYKLDTTNNDLYIFSYPGIQVSYSNGGLDLGTDLGIAFHSTYHSEEAYLIDYSTPGDFFVSANFAFVNASSVCAGDNIIAEIYADQADSVRWYVDNQYYTSSSILSYPTIPNQYVTYSIKAEVFYNGEMSSKTNNITLDPPAIPSTYTYTVDTTPCYGNPLPINVNPSGGNQSQTLIQVDYNGQTVYGPMQMQSSSFNLWIPNVVEEDTFQIITSTSDPCSTNADTITQGMIVGPNLLDFDHLSSDTAACIGEPVVFKLFNLDTSRIYDLNATFSTNLTSPTNESYSGVLDTLIFTPAPLQSGFSQSWPAPVYMYFDVEVSDSVGCSQTIYFDSIRYYIPKAEFGFREKTFLKGEEVEIDNDYPVSNRYWSTINLSNDYITNQTDTIPQVIGDTTGFFDINLRNEPLEGCIDSTKRMFHYADSSINVESCDKYFSQKDMTLMDIQYDNDNNYYQLGFNSIGSFSPTIAYELHKFDSTGNLIWSRTADYSNLYYMETVIIEEMDFDFEGNPICVGWISGEDDYDDGIFELETFSNTISQCFIFKLDKNTGDLIWVKNISEMPIYVPSNNQGLKVTDVLCNNEVIYVSMHYGPSNLEIMQFLTLDYDGDYIDHDELTVYPNNILHFISPFHYIQGQSYLNINRDSYRSPKMELLSDGSVVALSYFNSFDNSSSPIFNLNNSETGILALKYNTADGIHDLEVIASKGSSGHNTHQPLNGGYTPRFKVDKEDNIIVASFSEGSAYSENSTIHVLDSSIELTNSSFLFSMDLNYNLNWLTLGSHALIQDLELNKKTGDIYVFGATKNNQSYGRDTVNIVQGNTTYSDTNTVDPSNFMYGNNLYTYAKDTYMAKFNSSGVPEYIELFNFINYSSSWQGHHNLIVGSTPCGKMTLGFDGQPSSYEVDNDTINMDSLYIANYNDTCLSYCSFAEFPDTLTAYCIDSDTLTIKSIDYYNIDSVDYSLWLDNNLISLNEVSSFDNGYIEVPLPSNAGNYFELKLKYLASGDSTIILVSRRPSFTYLDSTCHEDTFNLQLSPSTYSYIINSISLNDTLYQLSGNDLNEGSNTLNIYSESPEGVSCFDTINFYINATPDDASFNFSNTICEGHINQISSSPPSYNYIWLDGAYNGADFSITDTNYQVGQNIIQVDIYSPYGCHYRDSISFYVDPCASLDNYYLGSSIQVSPNPNNGNFSIQAESWSDIKSITLESIKGEKIIKRVIRKEDDLQFDLELSVGTYILRIQLDNGAETKRILIR